MGPQLPYSPPPGGGIGDMQRFLKPGLVGGAVGGVLSSIPFLNLLNACFCLLNMVGAVVAVSMHLKDHPDERLSNGEAALCGAIAGATAGFIASILGFVVSLAFGTLMSGLYANLPEFAGSMAVSGIGTLLWTPFAMIGYAAMGALGGFLGMQLLFKDRLSP